MGAEASPEPLDVDHQASTVTFGRKGGCYVTKPVGVMLAMVFVSVLVATGLLVYYFAPSVRYSTRPSAKITARPPPVQNIPGPMIRTEMVFQNASRAVPSPAATTSTTLRMDTDTGVHSDPSKTSHKDAAEPTTEPTARKRRPDVRLPRALKPLRYLVKLQPFINGDFSIRGYVEVEMEVLEATSNITLHIHNIVTKNDTVRVMSSDDPLRRGPVILRHTYDPVRQFYVASLAEPLEVGKKYVLSMAFLGHLNAQRKGFFKSNYQDADGTNRWMAATMFQPTGARRAFPCFDEPGLKSTFEVYLAREEHMTSLSNMPLLESLPMEGQPGWVWDHYPPSVPMSTYLVTFAVSNFTHIKATYDDRVLLRVWARQEAIEHAHYSLELGQKMLGFYERYFDLAYPLPQMDAIALPENFGGMENWGLILYGEAALLYEEGVSSARDKQYIGTIVAHEVAHQWFGNLVTPKSWTGLWLNEGFATFMQYLAVDQAEPTWKVFDQFVFNSVQDSFAIDCLESSHPIHIPVEHPDDIVQIFDKITYRKGSSLIRMMSHFLTERTFRAGITNYLTAFQYSNSDQDELWEYLTEAALGAQVLPEGTTVKVVMDSWTLKMGYPVIHVARSGDGSVATLTQERFLLGNRRNESASDNYRWWVPLTYTGGDNPDFEVTQPVAWMADTEGQVTLSSLPGHSHWVIFNLQQTGYFRVNYDDHNWDLIIEQLLTDHRVIHTQNRAQIIDDALDLARAGHLSYDTALRVTRYLPRERDYVPWASALDNLQYLHAMFTHSADYGALRKYLLELVVPLYESAGFEDDLKDEHLAQYKRALAVSWACKLEYKPCVDSSLTLFHQWMFNPNNQSIISPNLRSTVYCTAVAAGGQSEWNFTWAQYLASSITSERQKLLDALGCSKQIWLLTRFLEMVFSGAGGIKKSETSRAFSSVARNPLGQHLVWDYFRNNWHHIKESTVGMSNKNFIKRATEALKTHSELEELQAFKVQHTDSLTSVAMVMDQALEMVANNVQWLDTNYGPIVEWITTTPAPH
nr:aminopeptidase N-like isoform X1 [Procambarus clarkii]